MMVLSLAAVMLTWRMGVLQKFEFMAYDWLSQRNPMVSGNDIVIVGIEEEDLMGSQQLWPLSDGHLADLLEAVLEGEPEVVSVLLLRDLSRKDDLEGHERLQKILDETPEVLLAVTFGENERFKPIPLMVRLSPQRQGVIDFPLDDTVDGNVRRALLYMSSGGDTYESMAMLTARTYLEKHSIYPEPSPESPECLKLGQETWKPLSSQHGAYLNVDASGYQIMIRGGKHDFPTYSLRDVLSRKVPNDALKGKIVIIGSLVDGVSDYLATASTLGQSAVELHTQVTQQLVSGGLYGKTALSVEPEWREALWILFWGLLGWGVTHYARSMVRLSFAVLLGGCILTAWVIIAFSFKHWFLWVTPGCGFLLCAGLNTVLAFYEEQHKRRLLMALFSKYTSPELAQKLLDYNSKDKQGQLPSVKMQATVLFCDLQGYTTLVDHWEPEETLNWLSLYTEAMSSCILEHAGLIEEFVGDGIIAIFGSPWEVEHLDASIKADAQMAVRCACAMEEKLKVLNEKLKSQGRPPALIRIGIYTGSLVMGVLGNRQRQKFGVVGSAMNVSARLQDHRIEGEDALSEAQPARILLGASTFEKLEDTTGIHFVESAKIKGISNAIDIYRIDTAAVKHST